MIISIKKEMDRYIVVLSPEKRRGGGPLRVHVSYSTRDLFGTLTIVDHQSGSGSASTILADSTKLFIVYAQD